MGNIFPRRHVAATTDREVFDVSTLEADIADTMRRHAPPAEVIEYAPPRDVGRLTSDAVLASYETAARSLEDLGMSMREMLKANDEMVHEANDALKQVEDTIAACREHGKLFALRITNSSDMIREVREACTALRDKIERPDGGAK